MDFISKSELYMSLLNQQFRIEELEWSSFIPRNKSVEIPNEEGLIILYDNSHNILGLAVSKDLNRRKGELLKDKRYFKTAYFRYTLESNRYKRFSTKNDFKHFLNLVESAFEKFENVLEDDDPRVIKRRNDIEEMRMKILSAL
ncbi:hypothetical protein [Paenibacillus solani]|uniref:Uncharacterized protein n=1 Tax=Paenibacillus solani TaxID=1705565 RepID=A0A0M1P0C0_9BACL|nr:hypothetical protein [Paenibacillus solani]KOR87896.1 hypothetical protein AM231_01255 [Paenibacillus solani]